MPSTLGKYCLNYLSNRDTLPSCSLYTDLTFAYFLSVSFPLSWCSGTIVDGTIMEVTTQETSMSIRESHLIPRIIVFDYISPVLFCYIS